MESYSFLVFFFASQFFLVSRCLNFLSSNSSQIEIVKKETVNKNNYGKRKWRDGLIDEKMSIFLNNKLNIYTLGRCTLFFRLFDSLMEEISKTKKKRKRRRKVVSFSFFFFICFILYLFIIIIFSNFLAFLLYFYFFFCFSIYFDFFFCKNVLAL